MSKPRTVDLVWLVGCVAAVAIVLFAFANPGSGRQSSTISPNELPVQQVPASVGSPKESAKSKARPTLEVINKRHILTGKDARQIAQYIADNELNSTIGYEGSVQILLARPIVRQEVPALGLGCLPDNPTSEEPPYILAIYKGNFTGSGSVGIGKANFVAMVIDVWAAAATRTIVSANGGELRQALNDPSLPKPQAEYPTNCPEWVPGSMPYGAVVPGAVLPTADPASYPTSVLPTSAVPAPVPTSETPNSNTIPQPVETGVP